MKQNEMLAMLHDIIAGNQEWTTWTVSTPHLVMLVNKAVEAEREACAQVCEGRNRDGDWFAAEIRARGQA